MTNPIAAGGETVCVERRLVEAIFERLHAQTGWTSVADAMAEFRTLPTITVHPPAMGGEGPLVGAPEGDGFRICSNCESSLGPGITSHTWKDCAELAMLSYYECRSELDSLRPVASGPSERDMTVAAGCTCRTAKYGHAAECPESSKVASEGDAGDEAMCESTYTPLGSLAAFGCTLHPGHAGDHIAEGSPGRECARWPAKSTHTTVEELAGRIEHSLLISSRIQPGEWVREVSLIAARAVGARMGATDEALYVVLTKGDGPTSEFVEVETADGKGKRVQHGDYPGDPTLWRLGPLYEHPVAPPTLGEGARAAAVAEYRKGMYMNPGDTQMDADTRRVNAILQAAVDAEGKP